MEIINKIKKSDKILIFAVIILAIIIRCTYLYSYQSLPEWEHFTVDNNYHHNWAKNIAEGNLGGDTTYFRAPLYPFLLAFSYKLFGPSIWTGKILGMVIGLLTLIMLYKLTGKIFDKRTALVASFLYSLYPATIYFESELLLDSLFSFLLLLAIYFYVSNKEKKETSSFLLSGLFLGLAAITRPTALIFLPFAIILIHRRIPEIKSKIKAVSIFLSPVIIIIGMILLRNIAVASDPVLISSQGGINFYIGNNDLSDGTSAVLPEPLGHNWRIKEISHIAETEEGRHLKPGEISSFWTARTIDWIFDNKLKFTKLYISKFFYNFSPGLISYNRNLPEFFSKFIILKPYVFAFPLLFLFAVISIITGFKNNKQVRVLFWLIIIYSLFVSLFFYNSRFRLPLLPYYFILSSAGILYFLDKLKSEKKKAVTVFLIAGAACLLTFVPRLVGEKNISPSGLISSGLFYNSQGKYDEALQKYRMALKIDSTFPELNLNIGSIFFVNSLEDSALYYFNREIKFNPARHKSYSNIASIKLLSDQYDSALYYAKKAVSLRSYDVNSNLIFLRALSEIQLLSNPNDNQFFVGILDSVLDKNRSSAAIYLEAGNLLLKHKELKKADSVLTLGIAIPKTPIEIDDNAFGSNYEKNLMLQKLQIAFACYQLGYLNGIKGDYESSIEYNSLAISLDSSLTDAYLNLINAYRMLNRAPEASQVYDLLNQKFQNNILNK